MDRTTKYIQLAAFGVLFAALGALIYLSYDTMNTIQQRYQVAYDEIVVQKGTVSRAVSQSFFLLYDTTRSPRSDDEILFAINVLTNHINSSLRIDIEVLRATLEKASDSSALFENLNMALSRYQAAAHDLRQSCRAIRGSVGSPGFQAALDRIEKTIHAFVRQAYDYDVALMQIEAIFSRTIHNGIARSARMMFFSLIGFTLMVTGTLAVFLKHDRALTTAIRDLKGSEDRLRQVTDNIPGMVYQCRREIDGPIAFPYVSPTFETYFGYTPGEIMADSRRVTDAVHPADAGRFRSEMIRSFKTLTPYNIEHRVVGRDGSWRWLHTQGIPRRLETGEVLWTGVSIDVTDRKRAERETERLQRRLIQAKKMEAVGIMAGGIAHEINNALFVIVGNSELAEDVLPPGSPAAWNLKEIQSAGLRARDVVRQLLTFSRKGENNPQRMDIAPIVKESLELIRSTIPANIEIHPEIEEGLDQIMADPSQIQQLLINLCKNAADAIGDRAGRISVRLAGEVLGTAEAEALEDVGPGRHVTLTVKDTGVGMDEKTLAQVFDPFFTTKAVNEGTGMGLSVVHGIVCQHHGAIVVESALGRGTTVTVRFPAGAEPEDLRGFQNLWKPRRSRSLPPTGSETVLVIDDEEAIRNLVTTQLTQLGYQVDGTTNPLTALEMVRADPTRFDLVITDMAMPNLTGTELAEALLAIRPDLPIILCTGYSETVSEETAPDHGIRAFAMKPLSKTDLAGTVRRVLDGLKAGG
jgi:PAS domain S-box-containing protein